MTARPIRDPGDLQRVMQTDFRVSDQQWAAISAPLEPAVVIAGAGSGKTALMAARVVYLVLNGEVSPDQVLGLTFTTKAASELRGRIRGALEVSGALTDLAVHREEESPVPTVATYNAYAASLLTDHGLLIGHEPDTRVMADGSRYQLAVRAIQRHRLPIEQLSDHPETVINYILALEGAMSEHLVEPQALLDLQAREHLAFSTALAEARGKTEIRAALSALERRDELIGLVGTYRALKTELGLMDFSDQIARAARLADQHPSVGEQERERYRIVLLDEYQDTSVAQALMLSKLFSGPDPDRGRGHAVTAVGDPNQAIYGWRGASVSNILGFGADFPRVDGDADVPVFPLTVNRRSDRRILEVANRLAAPLLATYPQVRPLQAPDGVPEGTVRVLVHESHPAELAWLPDEVLSARERLARERPAGAPVWREIGVLVRDNAHAAEVFDALSAREIPVEIVGLAGLVRLPEVAEVVATLTLLHDLTANAALLTLLTGPRWAIGPRDLALLGRRAKDLAGAPAGRAADQTLAEQLDTAVGGADPTEVSSLCDALDDPGEHPYSQAARTRFALLSAELRWLRSHTGEPLLDLVRRIIDACGIDVELASSSSPAATARRDNLDLFVRAVADFRAVDGDVSLAALLAYLQAEDELGNGLDVATPTEADSVKLLTVHRSKGLEWDVVFCLGVCEEKFPNTRGRSLWTSAPGVLPTPLRGDARDLPVLRGHEKEHLLALREESRRHDALEELRLGYVAFTRARHELIVSSWLWTEGRKSPLGPSPFQQTIAELLGDWGEKPEAWLDKPEKDTPNPLQEAITPVPWPVTEHTAEALRRLQAAELVQEVDPDAPDDLDMVEAALVAEWDAELDRLLTEARRGRSSDIEVPLPSSLSATSLRRLREDPAGFARDLARPMPRPPSDAASFGTRFHAWVEARAGQQNLLDPEDLPGQADRGIDDDADLQRVIGAFESGPFAERQPVATETPFALLLGGQLVRGRIDAVYAEPAGGHLVVDWKTGRREESDLLQLAVYRLAWAELHGVPLESVRAAFHYVRSGRTVEVTDQLPGRAELEAIVRAGSPPPLA